MKSPSAKNNPKVQTTRKVSQGPRNIKYSVELIFNPRSLSRKEEISNLDDKLKIAPEPRNSCSRKNNSPKKNPCELEIWNNAQQHA